MDVVAEWFHKLGQWLTVELFHLGQAPVTPAGILKFLAAVIIAIWVSRIIRRGLTRVSRRNPTLEATVYSISRVLHYVVIVVGFVVGLSLIGLDFTNLAIIAGAVGIGIGLGLQSIANNFISGLILLFERNMRVGDFVELESGLKGIVREIHVRSTEMRTHDNLDVIVPNSEFINGRFINWTLGDRLTRRHVPFGVAYGSDKELVEKAALEAARRVPFTVDDGGDRIPLVWLVGFGDSALEFELVVWVDGSKVRYPGFVVAKYLWEIETSLQEYGITIPFPQRDLHLKSGFPSESPGNDG